MMLPLEATQVIGAVAGIGKIVQETRSKAQEAVQAKEKKRNSSLPEQQ